MMTEQPPEFDDLFDGDEVKATDAPPAQEQSIPAELPPDAPVATHLIHNTNQQVGVELNVFFKSPTGFKEHMKFHGEDGKEVIKACDKVLVWMDEHGYTPERTAPTTAAAPDPTRQDLPQDGTASSTYCTIHQCEMKRWESADGKQVWYSHKIDGTDNWCKGK